MANPNPTWRDTLSLAAILTVVLLIPAAAQDTNDTDWQAQALQIGLTGPEVQQLETNRILITNQRYDQIYEAYPNRSGPSFITSDSLLNAYHVLYEESILRLEQASARQLPEILRFIMANLDAACASLDHPPDLVAAARQRAMIVLGTALKLLDDEFTVSDDTVMAIIEDEVAKIVAANVHMKPAWLGSSELDLLALDYTRYQVRGFYTQSDTLTRYFRAAAWLQSIPFRVSHDNELLSILILGSCLTPDRFGDDTETYETYRRFFDAYTEYLGVGDDWDVLTAADAVAGRLDFDLEIKRAELIAQAQQEGGPLINDQLRFAPDDPNAVAEPNFRIVAAYRLPDAVLFQRTTDIRNFPARTLPSGLEVCIALGSSFARENLEDPSIAHVLATIDANLDLFIGSSLYFNYLNVIAALLDTPEPNAPPFMATDPWQAKSCGTALAGWAQLRHTWVLQAKQPVTYSSGRGRGRAEPPPAFVEPDPEFFRRLADLAARTNDLLTETDAFAPNYLEAIETLCKVADLTEQADDFDDLLATVSSLPEDEILSLRWQFMYSVVMNLEGDMPTRAEQLRRMATDLAEGIIDPAIQWLVLSSDIDFESLWPQLEETSRHLESIARKQLAGVPLDANDTDLCKNYGGRLKTLMLNNGETLDKAPRIADVHTSPDSGVLHVGISRPRALYVLYPWRDEVVLCRGAVLPYYEFTDPDRLTDDEWKAHLDSPARPDLPTWLTPIVTPQGLSAPQYEPPNTARTRLPTACRT